MFVSDTFVLDAQPQYTEKGINFSLTAEVHVKGKPEGVQQKRAGGGLLLQNTQTLLVMGTIVGGDDEGHREMFGAIEFMRGQASWNWIPCETHKRVVRRTVRTRSLCRPEKRPDNTVCHADWLPTMLQTCEMQCIVACRI